MPDNQLQRAFEPIRIMGLRPRNRFIRSATLEGMALADGSPGIELIKIYQTIAEGGVGLISTSACLPDPSWSAMFKGLLVLHQKSDLTAWEDLIGTVHDNGALISLQMSPFILIEGKPAWPFEHQPGAHVLTRGEIEHNVLIFAEMAALARKIGFDAVQVHGGHGYSLAQFLSPHFNRRDDEYGGSDKGRFRIFSDIRNAIGERAGKDFPVWIKMNSFDGIPGGLVPDQAAGYAPLLEEAGYGAVEVTGGAPGGSHDSRGPLDKGRWSEGYYLEGAAKLKAKTRLPVSAVGGIRTLDMVRKIISEEIADMISLSRPLIREPGLINRWAGGDEAPSTCKSCNGCVAMMAKGKGLLCVNERNSAAPK